MSLLMFPLQAAYVLLTSTRFGTRYDALEKDRKTAELMVFAKQKLLNGESTLHGDAGPGILACLSVRFALEFNADTVSRAVACKQIEQHMRLCVAASSGLERLVTLSGSEPLLAEAASELLQETSVDPIDLLAKHSDLNCIDRGRRGELVAAFIIMQARDRAANARRWVSVCEFMEALLPSGPYGVLRSSMPTLCLQGEYKSFHETFKDYAMWFNHVIRVEDSNMLSIDNLWKFITRGAMVVCKQNQYGVDIVLPACLVNQNLSRDTVTAVLVQVKNATKYKDRIDAKVINAMDPFLVGLFSEGRPPRPVIRVVFALASQQNDVLFPTQRRREPHYADEFTAFDVWCAGLSNDTFRQLGNNLAPYRVLLDRSLQPHDAFDLNEINDPHPVDPDTKTERGLRRRKMAALVMSEVGHGSIHLQ